jgi:hypothetical protein
VLNAIASPPQSSSPQVNEIHEAVKDEAASKIKSHFDAAGPIGAGIGAMLIGLLQTFGPILIGALLKKYNITPIIPPGSSASESV